MLRSRHTDSVKYRNASKPNSRVLPCRPSDRAAKTTTAPIGRTAKRHTPQTTLSLTTQTFISQFFYPVERDTRLVPVAVRAHKCGREQVNDLSRPLENDECPHDTPTPTPCDTPLPEDSPEWESPILIESTNLKSIKPISRPVLVLDLDETLVHCSLTPTPNAQHTFVLHLDDGPHTIYVTERPFLQQFLHFCSTHFELVMFTASLQDYADSVVDLIDPKRSYFSRRLYRYDCTPHSLPNPINTNLNVNVNVNVEGSNSPSTLASTCTYMKDLISVCNDLSRVIIIDNLPSNFSLQPDNGIEVEDFVGAADDECLWTPQEFLYSENTPQLSVLRSLPISLSLLLLCCAFAEDVRVPIKCYAEGKLSEFIDSVFAHNLSDDLCNSPLHILSEDTVLTSQPTYELINAQACVVETIRTTNDNEDEGTPINGEEMSECENCEWASGKFSIEEI